MVGKPRNAAGQPYDENLRALTIDIMMPFYGDPTLFRAAVQSVLAQKSDDWRLVVIDDRYPDPSPGEWVRSLGDDRVKYVLNPANLGVSGNFAKSLDLVESEYFVLMGCDDILEPGYLAGMKAGIARFPDASYLQPRVTVIDDDGRPFLPLADRVKEWYRPRLATAAILRGEPLAVSLLRGNWTYFPSICWKTATARAHGFDPAYEVVLDLKLQLDIVMSGGSLAVLPERTFRYRRHEASVSSWAARDSSRFDEERAFFIGAATRLRALGWIKAAKAATHHYSSRLNAATKLPGALRSGDRQGRRGLLRHAFGGRNA